MNKQPGWSGSESKLDRAVSLAKEYASLIRQGGVTAQTIQIADTIFGLVGWFEDGVQRYPSTVSLAMMGRP